MPIVKTHEQETNTSKSAFSTMTRSSFRLSLRVKAPQITPGSADLFPSSGIVDFSENSATSQRPVMMTNTSSRRSLPGAIFPPEDESTLIPTQKVKTSVNSNSSTIISAVSKTLTVLPEQDRKATTMNATLPLSNQQAFITLRKRSTNAESAHPNKRFSIVPDAKLMTCFENSVLSPTTSNCKPQPVGMPTRNVKPVTVKRRHSLFDAFKSLGVA